MISPDKQFEFVTTQISAQIDRIYDAFKRFIQLFSAIVAGTVWLATEVKISGATRASYATITDVLVGLVALVTTVLILGNLHSWWGYRRAQMRLTQDDINLDYRVPPPKLYPSCTVETAMLVCVAAAYFLFWWDNPSGAH